VENVMSVTGTIVTLLGAIVLGIIPWSFNIKSKVDIQAQQIMDMKELIDIKFDNVIERLKRIETALNGSLKH